MKVLFVCLGNICRSPLAEGIAEHIVKQKALGWHIDSAGTSNYHEGENPCPNSIKVGLQNGIDISSQRSRPLVYEDFERFDIILALDSSNYQNISKMKDSHKLFKLGEFGLEGADIPDPYGFADFERFEKVYSMIEKCVGKMVENLTEKGASAKNS